jgi:predicted Fe-S protein YdhL (DUF1289 family)
MGKRYECTRCGRNLTRHSFKWYEYSDKVRAHRKRGITHYRSDICLDCMNIYHVIDGDWPIGSMILPHVVKQMCRDGWWPENIVFRFKHAVYRVERVAWHELTASERKKDYRPQKLVRVRQSSAATHPPAAAPAKGFEQ